MVNAEKVKSKILELGDTFIFAGITAVLAFLCIYFGILVALPAFLASAFFIYVVQESKYSKLRNTVGGWVIAVAIGVLSATVLKVQASFLPDGFLSLVLSVLLATIVMVLTGMVHPPAIAILVWFATEPFTSKGAIGIMICLGAILGLQAIIIKVAGNLDEELPSLDAEKFDEEELKL